MLPVQPLGQETFGREPVAEGQQSRIRRQLIDQRIALPRGGVIFGPAQRRIAPGGDSKHLRGEIGQHPAHPRQDRIAHQPLAIAGEQVTQHRHDRTQRTALARQLLLQDRLELSAVGMVNRVFAHPARITHA
jgi:hypothetical protein